MVRATLKLTGKGRAGKGPGTVRNAGAGRAVDPGVCTASTEVAPTALVSSMLSRGGSSCWAGVVLPEGGVLTSGDGVIGGVITTATAGEVVGGVVAVAAAGFVAARGLRRAISRVSRGGGAAISVVPERRFGAVTRSS